MSARGAAPIVHVGQVAIYAPTTKGYYRLKWTEPDGRPGDTSGGRDLDSARWQATEIDFCLSGAAGPRAVTRLAEIFESYLAAGHSPYKGKKPWKPANKLQIEDNLGRCLRGFRGPACHGRHP